MDDNASSGPKTFAEDVQLFACKLIDEKVLNFNQFDDLVALAPSGAGLLDFAQLIIDSDICEDLEKVQAVLDRACDAIAAGKKAPYDPFDTGEDDYAEPLISAAPVEPEVETPSPFSGVTPENAPDSAPLKPHDDRTDQRPRIPLPKTNATSKDDSLDLTEAEEREKIKFNPTEPPENTPPAADFASKVLEGLSEASASEDEPVSTSSQNIKKPIALAKKKSSEPKKDLNLEELAAAAIASLSKGNGSAGGPAPIPEAPPASAQSTAEKPNETVIQATGHKPQKPDFSDRADLEPDEARAFMVSLMLYCSEGGYSDLHLSADARPFARKFGEVEYLSGEALSAEFCHKLNTSLLSEEQLKYFEEQQDYDFAIPFETGHRFRTNLMIHKDGIAGTYRIVPNSPAPIQKLGYSDQRTDVLKKMLTYHNGLVLVTGPVGAGKTMTLASLVAEMNQNRTDHIICVEEPIEIVHASDQCSVTQRGVGPHTNTFHSALKGALRQDPDIIVIGEMRDLETIEMAISASETGHLVIGTMHTSDASNTLNRLLDVFPPAQQPQIRAMVAESLKGIVCQRLLPSVDGGVVLACELLLNNLAVAALIREGKSQGLSNIMETGKKDGMILMDNSVMELYREGRISKETAKANIKNEVLLRSLEPAAQPKEPESDEAEQSKKRGFFRK